MWNFIGFLCLFQFDTEFVTASTSVKKITTLREFYNKSLTKFKEGCQLAQIVEKEENSLEDCVAALKQHIGEGAKLKVRDRTGAKQWEGAKLNLGH